MIFSSAASVKLALAAIWLVGTIFLQLVVLLGWICLPTIPILGSPVFL